MDDFYDLLGERNWVFHDSLNVEKVKAIVDSSVSAEDAEQQLIALYQEPDTLRFMTMRFNGHEALRSRRHLIEGALADYEAGRYSSTVLILLTVMDGFVNDFESKRRGLHARDEDDMHAWDSVAGHHLGLGHAHKSFTKSTGKTTEAECFELHRNGILHGTILNYNNVIVATKAWNRLFAVGDWATSREKQKKPVEPEPTLREVLGQIAGNARAKKAIDAWRPSVVSPGEPGHENSEVYQASVGYLSAWQQKNYGRMAGYLPVALSGTTPNQTAGRVRSEAELFELTSFTVGALLLRGACHLRGGGQAGS